MFFFRSLQSSKYKFFFTVCFLLSSDAASSDNLNYRIDIPPVLVLDLRKALNESVAGRALINNYRGKVINLNNEFNAIEAQLVAEEQNLSEMRRTMEAIEFIKLAEVFDAKSSKTRELYRTRKQRLETNLSEDTDRLGLVLSQIAGAIMEEKGALMVMMKNQVIVSSNQIDITSIVMDRANKSIDVDNFLNK